MPELYNRTKSSERVHTIRLILISQVDNNLHDQADGQHLCFKDL